MIVPLGTDRDGRRPPRATTLLIALNLAMYAAMKLGLAALWTPRATLAAYAEAFAGTGISRRELLEFVFVTQMQAQPGVTPWWSYLTAMFTHSPSSVLHIAGNMIFLWAFGKSIESHLGFWRFLLLYLGGGIAAWLAHALVSDAPGIGASGATSCVACLFLTFFPRSRTKVLFLFGLSIHYVPSVWLIGLYLTIDVVRLVLDTSGVIPTNVAAGAHLGGALFGFAGGLLLLKLGWAPRGDWDLLHLIKQWMRRQSMRRALAGSGPTPWQSGKARGSIVSGEPLGPGSSEAAALRATITAALRSGDAAAAGRGYASLLAINPGAGLPADAQLDLANRLLRNGDVALAAQAYANFLTIGPQPSADPRSTEVRLLLATLSIRRLGRPDVGLALLAGLEDRVVDQDQKHLIVALRAEAAAASKAGPPRAPGIVG
jgi:membrane associated rhomboid family serine protease